LVRRATSGTPVPCSISALPVQAAVYIKDETMLKRELVDEVAGQLPDYYKQDVAQAVDIILEEISQALTEGRRVEIRGFGSFSVRTRKPRTTKNPKTGKIMDIPARKTLHFTMSKSLKEVLIEG
jgi:integration host factor subunit beta